MTQNKLNILLLLLFLIQYSCNSKISIDQEPKPPLNERIKLIYKENSEEKLVFQIKFPEQHQKIYQLNHYESIWIKNKQLTNEAKYLIQFFDSTELYGLPKEIYPINKIKENKDPLQSELALTESLIRFRFHIEQGILDSNRTKWNLKSSESLDKTPGLIVSNHTNIHLIDSILQFQPNNFHYKHLLSAWQKYYRTTEWDTTRFSVPTIKEDSIKSYDLAKQILLHRNYLDSVNVNTDSLFLVALGKYQKEFDLKDDKIIGTNTVLALQTNTRDQFLKVVLAIEKMKWNKQLPNKYFKANIAEQKIRLIDSNRIILEHRIIVGHLDTKTPELKSKLRTIVLYPDWRVPHSISSTEILQGIKRDTGYFRKKSYTLFKGNNEIDPQSVSWKKYNEDRFPFRVKQNPGPKNSLGVIKFLFPNEHDVYLHDTPTKWLFNTNSRYYSHGCMRLENPLELAEYILKTDPKQEFIADSLYVEIEKEEQQTIYLRKPIPIYIEYQSVNADSLGNINFFVDVYNRDEKLIKAILEAN